VYIKGGPLPSLRLLQGWRPGGPLLAAKGSVALHAAGATSAASAFARLGRRTACTGTLLLIPADSQLYWRGGTRTCLQALIIPLPMLQSLLLLLLLLRLAARLVAQHIGRPRARVLRQLSAS
jgi:hypothetical protein